MNAGPREGPATGVSPKKVISMLARCSPGMPKVRTCNALRGGVATTKDQIQGDIMLAKENIDELLSRHGNVLSTEGDKIGSIGQV